MLHIIRKAGEEIRIGDDIRIVVTRTRSGSVCLSFEAPEEIPIFRGEIYQRLLAESRGGRSQETTSKET